MFNNNEKKFIDIINEAKRYVEGELELDYFDGEWYAMDYKENLGGAFEIKAKQYSKPLITDEEAEKKDIDIIKCCNECGIFYVA